MLRSAAAGVNQSAQSATFNTLTVTGQGFFADGSAISPSIAFEREPGLGMFRAAANSVAFASAGSEWLRIVPSSITGLLLNNGIPLNLSGDSFVRRDAAGLLGMDNSIGVRGGAGFGMRAISGSYSVQTNDFTICCSTATQGFTVLLPNTPAMNQYLNVKKVSADANRLIIDGNGNLIDALSTQSTIATTRPSFALQFGSTVSSPTGSAWQIL